MNIYKIQDNYFTGEVQAIGDSDPAPKGWTRTAPPALTGTQVARWENKWVVLPVMPPPHPEAPETTRTDFNAPILAALAAADLTIVRALVEGDAPRIAAHKIKQAALRATLEPEKL
jgi:hypothetical protein